MSKETYTKGQYDHAAKKYIVAKHSDIWGSGVEMKGTRKATKSTSGHPPLIYGKSGRKRKYLAFTKHPTTKGKNNIKLEKNIDGESSFDSYLRPIPLYANDDEFEEGKFNYALRTERDKEIVKKYKK